MRAAMILGSVIALAGCNFSADAIVGDEGGPSGVKGSRSFDLSGFDSVSALGHHNVVVTVGQAASVRAEGDTGELDRLEIEVRRGDLRIGTKKGARWSWGGDKKTGPITIFVTMPSIKGASIAGSGDMKVDKAEGDAFEGSIAGSGDLSIAAMKVYRASFSIAGSGNIMAAGTADKSDISIAGSGDLDLAKLQTRETSVSIAGSGDVRAYASQRADVNLMGGGDVTIDGGAKCEVSKMGGGTVRCGNG